tara:strand:- start:1158 stop:1517 length:360 start_codon:yes stop_codon:yes gene_type:complete
MTARVRDTARRWCANIVVVVDRGATVERGVVIALHRVTKARCAARMTEAPFARIIIVVVPGIVVVVVVVTLWRGARGGARRPWDVPMDARPNGSHVEHRACGTYTEYLDSIECSKADIC